MQLQSRWKTVEIGTKRVWLGRRGRFHQLSEKPSAFASVCLSPWLPARWRCLCSASEPRLQTRPSKEAWIVRTGPRPRLHTRDTHTSTHITCGQTHTHTHTRVPVCLFASLLASTELPCSGFVGWCFLFKVMRSETTDVRYRDRPSAGAPAPCRRWSGTSCRSGWTGCLLPGRRSARSGTDTADNVTISSVLKLSLLFFFFFNSSHRNTEKENNSYFWALPTQHPLQSAHSVQLY